MKWLKRLTAGRPSATSTATFCTIIQTLLLLVGTYYGIRAFEVYKSQNIVNVRAQLYAAERELADRESQTPVLQLAFLRLGASVPPANYAAAILLQCLPPKNENPEGRGFMRLDLVAASFAHEEFLVQSNTAKKLFEILWSESMVMSPELTNLRALYLHIEKYLYHLHNAYDYDKEGVLPEGEWEEWNGLIRDIGPHPVMLACLFSANEHGYLSKSFAAELQNTYRSDARMRAVVGAYYPEMLDPHWLNAFRDRGE
jgi:hypothetical protein